MKRYLRFIPLGMLLFILLPFGAEAAKLLIPAGNIIGLRLRDNTVTVAAYDDLLGAYAMDAGLCIGDRIQKIDDQIIESTEDVHAALAASREEVAVTVNRKGKSCTLHMIPRQTKNGPRLGVYLRQGISGIGTVTWYDPDTGRFGTLGHGVSNSQGALLPMTGGSVYDAEIISVIPGRSGKPGQLRGSARAEAVRGQLLRNTPQGVFGITREAWLGEPLPVACFSQVHTGEATIRSTVSGTVPREYSVEILKIYPQSRSDSRNFLLKVTDSQLLTATGGIVQGMSGSPVIQDGRIVGAVTHVLVNDPTVGYGIFIENMLKAAA